MTEEPVRTQSGSKMTGWYDASTNALTFNSVRARFPCVNWGCRWPLSPFVLDLEQNIQVARLGGRGRNASMQLFPPSYSPRWGDRCLRDLMGIVRRYKSKIQSSSAHIHHLISSWRRILPLYKGAYQIAREIHKNVRFGGAIFLSWELNKYHFCSGKCDSFALMLFVEVRYHGTLPDGDDVTFYQCHRHKQPREGSAQPNRYADLLKIPFATRAP